MKPKSSFTTQGDVVLLGWVGVCSLSGNGLLTMPCALQIVDTLTVAGPRASGSYNDNTPVNGLVQWPLPKCGTGTIKFRTELTVSAKKEGAKGTVSSEQLEYEGKTVYYGLQQGVSYDWEKCAA